MREFGERLQVAEAILRELSRASLRRVDLEKRVLKATDFTHTSFDTMFAFLVCDGDLEKASADHFAPFRLTNRGKDFLAWRAKR